MEKNFFGNHQVKNPNELVEKLLKSLQGISADMSVKYHFLLSQLDKFPDNCSDVSDEQGERFHQDIKTMEECYQGQRDKRMMADFCWNIKRDLNNITNERHSRLVGWLGKFYGISTFIGYLTTNPFLCK